MYSYIILVYIIWQIVEKMYLFLLGMSYNKIFSLIKFNCNWIFSKNKKYLFKCIIQFFISYPKYTAPEVFLSSGVSSSKVDSWSLGMIIAELLLGKSIWPGVKLSQCLRKVLSLIHCETSVFERLARETNCYNIYKV